MTLSSPNTTFDAQIDALTDAAQFIDAVKVDAQREGWWTEWDGQMREKITVALKAAYAAKERTCDAHNKAGG